MHTSRNAVAVVLEAAPCSLDALASGTVRTYALVLEAERPRNRLVLQLVYGVLVVDASPYREYVPRLQRSLGYQGLVHLLGYEHDARVSGVLGIDVAQVHIHELDAGHDLELLLHTPPSLDGVLEDHARIFLVDVLVWKDKLHESAEGPANAYLVACVEVAVQPEKAIDMMGVVPPAHLLAELAQAVGDEAVVAREQIAAHLGYLPTGKVAVDAVEERRIFVEFRRERIEQVRGLEHVVHAVVDVSLEDEGGVSAERLPAPGVRAARHVALEDLDGVRVLEVHARHLVEGDAVPVADEPGAFHARRVPGTRVEPAEEVRRGGLTTGEQDGIRAHFVVYMALARSARPELAKIVVTFNQGYHALDEVEFRAQLHASGFIARAAQEQVDPLVGSEPLPLADYRVEVEPRHLDGGEVGDLERVVFGTRVPLRHRAGLARLVEDVGKLVFQLVLETEVFHLHDAPHATGEHLGIFAGELVGHHHGVDSEIGERRHVDITVLVNLRGHLVDNGVGAQVAYLRLDAFRLVRSHVVLGQDSPDAVEPLLDRLLVIGRAVHAQ